MTYQDDNANGGPAGSNRFGNPGLSPATVSSPGNPIGHVTAVDGARASAKLAEAGKALQIGALVKMQTTRSIVYGMVKALHVTDGSDGDSGIMDIELVGETTESAGSTTGFNRGVSCYPTLGDPIFPANQDDLRQVYAQPNVSATRIGSLYQDPSLSAYISIDDFLGKHFAVLGTTGSGKSCTVSTMLRSVLNDHKQGHVLLLDLHGEYDQAFSDCAELLGAGQFTLPYWLLNFEELREIVVEKTANWEVDSAILQEAVLHAKQAFHADNEDIGLLDSNSPVPYHMAEVVRYLDAAMGKLENPAGTAPYMRLRNRLRGMLADRRFQFMFMEGFAKEDDMEQLLARLFRVPANDKPITILDLSAVPSDIMKVVISLLCRLTFDFAYWGEGDTPVLLVCEEAHRYASSLEDSGFDLTKRALSRIVNEGRKYGVSLGLVSQRPSELDLGILSQCSTVFAMRMNNQRDQEFVRGTLSESGLGLTDALPSLRTGEAVVVGEGIAVPMRIYMDLLPENLRPRSSTAEFSKFWKQGEAGAGAVSGIVRRWRHQRR